MRYRRTAQLSRDRQVTNRDIETNGATQRSAPNSHNQLPELREDIPYEIIQITNEEILTH